MRSCACPDCPRSGCTGSLVIPESAQTEAPVQNVRLRLTFPQIMFLLPFTAMPLYLAVLANAVAGGHCG